MQCSCLTGPPPVAVSFANFPRMARHLTDNGGHRSLPVTVADDRDAKHRRVASGLPVEAASRRTLLMLTCVGLLMLWLGASSTRRTPSKPLELAVHRIDTTPVQIPRLIHQSWKSTDKIPSRFAPWMRSWVQMHPGWQYVYWGDDDNLALFEKLYPKYLDVARQVGKIGLADMARYALLHRLGGLYVDADFECKQPFDKLHREYDVFLSSEPRAHAILLEGSPTPALCNALMASVPGHPFWIKVLDSIKEAYESGVAPGDTVTLTGPRIVKKAYETSTNTDVVVLDPEYFYPEVAYWNMGNLKKKCDPNNAVGLVKEACDWLDRFPNGEFTNNTYATHHWQCTWCHGDGKDEFVSLTDVMRHETGASMIIFKPRFFKDDDGKDALGVEYYPLAN